MKLLLLLPVLLATISQSEVRQTRHPDHKGVEIFRRCLAHVREQEVRHVVFLKRREYDASSALGLPTNLVAVESYIFLSGAVVVKVQHRVDITSGDDETISAEEIGIAGQYQLLRIILSVPSVRALPGRCSRWHGTCLVLCRLHCTGQMSEYLSDWSPFVLLTTVVTVSPSFLSQFP